MTALAALIDRAVALKGSQAKLADAMGCSQQQISYLRNEAKSVTAEMAIAIDAATHGQISRHELRPDVFGPAKAGAA